MGDNRRFLTTYAWFSWLLAGMLFLIFLIGILSGFLSVGYALASLIGSVISIYLGLQVSKIRKVDDHGRDPGDDRPLDPAPRVVRYPPMSRLLAETLAVTVIIVLIAVTTGSIAAAVVTYLVAMLAIGIFEFKVASRH